MLLSGAAPIPVLAACQGDVGRGRHRSLPGAHKAPVRLVLGVALEVLLERGHGALLLVHSNPPPSTSSGAELRSTPEIVIAQAAVVLVKTAHVRIRSGGVQACDAGPSYSSDAIQIHIQVAINILSLLREAHGRAIGMQGLS